MHVLGRERCLQTSVNDNNKMGECRSALLAGHQVFWSVVRSQLSSEERRLLLLFITGTDRLPETGCETLSIEVRATSERLRLQYSPPRNNFFNTVCTADVLHGSTTQKTKQKRRRREKATLRTNDQASKSKISDASSLFCFVGPKTFV